MSEVAGQALPSGTLTFLFTDIEGSTGLAQELGPEGYGDVLVQHRELLRAAWAAHGGTEVGTEGDSFFVVFAAAPAAVAAAVDAQRALAAAHFPHGVATVRVRMGLHTGLGVLSGGTYVGADVNRAARIAAAAGLAAFLVLRELVEAAVLGVLVELGAANLIAAPHDVVA